jgi:cytochrome c peroxidase
VLKGKYILVAFLGAVALVSCQIDPALFEKEQALLDVPSHFPSIDFPEDNEFTESRWLLGKQLFYDQRLSQDNSVSCASCHKQDLAFADNTSFSPGVENRPGVRNSPSLANVAYHPYLTREGGVPTLEMQVLVPIQEHNEFGFNIIDIAKRLESDSNYSRLSKEAYDRPLDYFVITRAIATFERSLISGNSAYDMYLSKGDLSSLSKSQIAGMKLFQSNKTNCSSCHSGFNFTNYAFINNGLYKDYNDLGRKRLTGLEQDLALFKVPSLRNVELTAPYMHDGSISTLEEVIEHYNQGGTPHQNKHHLIKPLNLNDTEKAQLIAFLKSLTDKKFTTNINFKK